MAQTLSTAEIDRRLNLAWFGPLCACGHGEKQHTGGSGCNAGFPYSRCSCQGFEGARPGVMHA